MKKLQSLALALLLAATSYAAETLPVFNATLTVGKEHHFVLVNSAGKASSFLRLGQSFDGYKLKSYDATTGLLEIEKDGKSSKLSIAADAAIKDAPVVTPATLDDAQAVLTAMNFEEMMNKTFDGLRKQQKGMMEKMMGQMLPPNADPETKAAVIEMQKKMMDVMMSAMDAAEMRNDVAKVYSEVFTKEELQGLGAFYQSTAGKAFSDKQPELQAKMGEVMAPRMMAAMPKVQGMMRDFVMEQRAKQEAAKASGNAGAGATTPAPSSTPVPSPKN